MVKKQMQKMKSTLQVTRSNDQGGKRHFLPEKLAQQLRDERMAALDYVSRSHSHDLF